MRTTNQKNNVNELIELLEELNKMMIDPGMTDADRLIILDTLHTITSAFMKKVQNEISNTKDDFNTDYTQGSRYAKIVELIGAWDNLLDSKMKQESIEDTIKRERKALKKALKRLSK